VLTTLRPFAYSSYYTLYN